MTPDKRFRLVVILPLCSLAALFLLLCTSASFAAPAPADLYQTATATPQAEEEPANSSQDVTTEEAATQDSTAQDSTQQDTTSQDDTAQTTDEQTTPTGTEPQIYVVQAGDTLLGIAQRYTTTVAALVTVNNLANPNFIFIGQQLRIPTGEEVTTPTAVTPTGDVTVPVTTTAPVTVTAPLTETATVTETTVPTGTAVLTSTGTATEISSPWTTSDVSIEVISPVSNTRYHSPIEIIGFAQTFEGIVNIRLLDSDGNVLAERAALGGSAEGHQFFHTYLRFVVTEEVSGTLELFEFAASGDNQPPDVVIPLTLLPGQRFIDLGTPNPGDNFCGTVAVAGYSLTFEGNVPVTLAERDGTPITTVPTTGGGQAYRDFGLTIEDVTVDEPRPLLVSAYEVSAADGVQIDTIRIPISVYPVGHAACP